jgi:hypothetical protein
MVFVTKKHLSRRAVLRGAGAVISLPLLESMIPAGAARAATVTPTRFACVYIPHGAVMKMWTPSTEGTDFEFTPTLKALEPFRDRVNVISNLTLPLAYGTDASAGANHARSSAVWLTGAKPSKDPVPVMGISVDQVAAAHMGQETPLPSLELSLEGTSTISWRTPTAPQPMENNPQTAFTRLFGEGSTPEQRTARRVQSKSLLDSVMGEIASLEGKLPASDRERVERYLTDVREVERRINLAATQVSADLALPERPAGIPSDYEDHVKILFDLLALAWQADVTRVATMMIAKETSQAVYLRSGINEGFHNLSHHSEITTKKERLARLNAYHIYTTTGYFAERLRNTPDGDGTLLDHSVVLHGSGMSNSNQHDHEPLPIFLVGGASGALAGGRHIVAAANTPLSNLQVALLNKVGVPTESFGDSTGALEI